MYAINDIFINKRGINPLLLLFTQSLSCSITFLILFFPTFSWSFYWSNK